MVQDRCIVSIKVKQEVIGDIAGDLGSPLTPENTPISTFCVAFHIFVVDEHRDFKFGVQVDHSKSQPTTTNCP